MIQPKKAGRKKGTKKMFTFRVEESQHEILKEIAIYLNSVGHEQKIIHKRRGL